MSVTVALLLLRSAYLGTAEAASAPPLGTAVTFAVLGGTTVTNTGATLVTGNLGTSPGPAVTGFPPGVVVPPSTINAANAVSLQAQTDVTTAYNNLAGQACNVDLTGQDLGGLTLTPGVYCFPSTAAQLTGIVTLNAQNNANAVFVFQIGSTLTTATGASVNIIGGGSACNVYWQVGSATTLGTGTAFKGNVLSDTSISVTMGASISPGRAFARSGAVTLDTNSVSLAGCEAATPTPLPATQTVVAATQTFVAPTLTLVAATQTAFAATQTAIAPTPTRTTTPAVSCADDKLRPTGTLTGTGTDNLGHKFIRMTARDTGSGIATIVVTKTINAVTIVDGFVPGTTQPVLVTSTKINPAMTSIVELRITDRCGNFVLADPVLTLLSLDKVKALSQAFKNIPPEEHFVTVTNGAPGLKRLELVVNGIPFVLDNLKNNEVRALNVQTAMNKKSNRVKLIGSGKKGAAAFIIISDSAMEQPAALSEFIRAETQSATDNFTWGDLKDVK
nr:ice-binding protein [bacterium]